MAIYNPKRARELEAAARLAESQRQRELAKGQREQRTTEQILGLVEGLIGAAPQAAQAFEQSQAERVLAGERPLEMEEAKDPFTSLGRFLFEPGIQRKVQQMAPERLAKGREVMKPLTTQEVTKGLAGKYEEELGVPLPPQMGAERAARDVMEKVPAAKFVPEAQREALAVGDVQRVQAERAAAEREAELFGLEKRKIEAEAGAKEAQAKKFLTEAESKKQQVAPAKMKELSKAIVMGVRSFAQDLKSDLNSTDPNVRGMAIDRLNEQVLLEAGTIRNNDGTLISQDSPLARAAASEAVSELAKELDLPPLNNTEIKNLANEKDTIEQVANLVDRRANLGDFNVEAADVIAQRLASATPSMLGAKNFIEQMRKLAFESGLTNEQFSWLKDATILKNRLVTSEFKGTGAISDQERASIIDEVLTPIATYEQFRQRAYDTLNSVARKYSNLVDTYKKVSEVPDNLISFADRLSQVRGGDPEGLALRILGEKPTGGKQVAFELTEETSADAAARLGMAPGQVIGGTVSRGIDFLADVIQRAIGGGDEKISLISNGARRNFTIDTLTKMAAENPQLFNSIVSQNPEMAQRLNEIVGGRQ